MKIGKFIIFFRVIFDAIWVDFRLYCMLEVLIILSKKRELNFHVEWIFHKSYYYSVRCLYNIIAFVNRVVKGVYLSRRL